MKKVIVFVFVVLSVVSVAIGQSRDRVKIEVYGFQDNQQAQLLISQYAMAIAGNEWQLVAHDPEFIMIVRANVHLMKSWSEYDRKAVAINSGLRAANDISRSIIYSGRSRSRIGWTLRNAGSNAVQGQLANQRRQEIQYFQKWRATVEIRLVDAKTRKVHSIGIGQENVVVRNLNNYGFGQPLVILVDGDLTGVGIHPGENLDGNLRQLIALSAFKKSDLPENSLVN
ncbi:MAG TPA: hypothetical protein PKD79_03095 [Candidatus Doudnabacteria bacterium]|nr:hypothetical protein [Candidatus Doudnabacteria bacterium]